MSRGCIFSHVRPFYEQAVSDLDPKRYMLTPVKVARRSFIEGSHRTKNTASLYILVIQLQDRNIFNQILIF